MRCVVVTTGDILTPLGNLKTTWEGLKKGRSGLLSQGFGTLNGAWPLGIIDNLPGRYGGWERLRSLFDVLHESLPHLPRNTSLFCATTKAAVDELFQAEREIHGQPWQVAEYLNSRLGLPGPPAMVSAACASSLIAIIQGAQRISNGTCDHALVVGFDLLSEFVLAGFDSLMALSRVGARPFDRSRDGLSLSEGAGWLLLSAEDKVSDKERILARLAAWAISCDATHITAPCRRAGGLIQAIRQVQALQAGPFGGINAHGTGTVYNDAMELLAFKETCDIGIPICSVKGALGHSLAAAGLVEALLSIKSLREGALPPTAGLMQAEASTCSVSGTECLALSHPNILTCNSGFGGINAALLLQGKASVSS